jgi:hypothetical protein
MPVGCSNPKDKPPSPVTRTCCMLSDYHDILDEADVTSSYTFGGGPTGIMYTCNGGFLDFGHLFDYVDLTLYYYHFLTKDGANVPGKTIPLYHNSGTVTIKQNVPEVDRPTTAASIAFDFSVFYEILTYWRTGVGRHNSSFSPEDLVSNYLGTRVAERALKAKGKKFDAAVNAELKLVLGLLLPRTKAQTDEALKAIDKIWVTDVRSMAAMNFEDYLKRRNFTFSSIAPCFVTAPAIGCTGTPAFPSSLGTSYPASIRDLYDVEYIVDHPQPKAKLGNTVARGSFSSLITTIRADPGAGTACP